MPFHAMWRLGLFATYLTVLISVPFAILWELPGLYIGLAVSGVFFVVLRHDGAERIARKLDAQPLSAAHAPQLFAIIQEYCRRLNLPVPKVSVMETPALNLALYGFSPEDATVVITRGALTSLNRSELAAVVGRQLASLWHGDVYAESWLCRFLSVVDALATRGHRHATATRRFYSFKHVLRHAIAYPLALFPVLVLRNRRNPVELDLKSARLTRKPQALAEAMRLMDAMKDRIPFHVPFPVRHLFLLPPAAQDPMSRMLFDAQDFSDRILGIQELQSAVTLS